MDPVLKLRHSIDALFGNGISKHLPKDIEITFSKKNGKIKTVFCQEKLLCTLKVDGSLAISPHLAQILLKTKSFKQNCVEVDRHAAPFVKEGRSVFCKHVLWCGKNVRISAETPILFEGRVIAVGRAVLSCEMIRDFDRGVAVKVRNGLKSPKME